MSVDLEGLAIQAIADEPTLLAVCVGIIARARTKRDREAVPIRIKSACRDHFVADEARAGIAGIVDWMLSRPDWATVAERLVDHIPDATKKVPQ